MNKTDLINVVIAETGLAEKDVKAVVNATFDAVSNALKESDKVQLIGFGTFEVKKVEARDGRNPQTGAAMEIAASQTLSFKPSSVFKSAVPAKKTCKKGGCKKK